MTAVIGGYNDSLSGFGATWAYALVSGVWTEQAKILGDPSALTSTQQGTAVAISGDGNTILTGDPTDNSDAGAVWVFKRAGSTWVQQGAKIRPNDGGGSFGAGVSLSRDGSTAFMTGGGAWPFGLNANFGSVNFSSLTPTIQPLQISVPAGVKIDSVGIVAAGVAGKDYTDGGSSTCSSAIDNTEGTSPVTCAVSVSFLPLKPGLRQGAVVIVSDNTSVSSTATVPIYGMADAPQVAIGPGAVSVLSAGTYVLNAPTQMATDGGGNLYITDQQNNAVLQIPPGGGSSTAINIASASFSGPAGLAIDGAGNVYVGNVQSHQILTFNLNDNSLTARALAIGGVNTALIAPYALAVDVQGNLYIGDGTGNRIIKVVITGAGTSAVTGTGSIVSLGGYTFSNPSFGVNGVAIDANGNLYVSDSGDRTILKIAPSGTVSTLSFPGWLTFESPAPYGLSVDGLGNVYFTDANTPQVTEQTASGVTTVVAESNAAAGFGFPAGVFVDPSGILYVSDQRKGPGRIVKMDPTAPAATTFQTTAIGVTSVDSPATYTLIDNGDRDLVFTASGATYPADFPVNSSDINLCLSGGTVSAGSSCDVSINFIPTTSGGLSEAVTLTDNNLNGTGGNADHRSFRHRNRGISRHDRDDGRGQSEHGCVRPGSHDYRNGDGHDQQRDQTDRQCDFYRYGWLDDGESERRQPGQPRPGRGRLVQCHFDRRGDAHHRGDLRHPE